MPEDQRIFGGIASLPGQTELAYTLRRTGWSALNYMHSDCLIHSPAVLHVELHHTLLAAVPAQVLQVGIP